MGFFDAIKNKRYINEIHPSLKDLVYIEKHVPERFDPSRHEPSTIYLDLPVTKPDACTVVSAPGYLPAYAQFGREQRYEYLQFLSNPFVWHYDAGYFFCLFYGIERQLQTPKFERATEVVFDLLKACSDESFQNYAAKSLFFSAERRRAVNVIRKMISSGIAYRLDVNTFIYAKILAKLPFTPEDLLHYSNPLGLKSKYLPEKEDVFLEKLREAMKTVMGTDETPLDSLLDAAKEEDLPRQEHIPFANPSLHCDPIFIYDFTELPNFRAACEVALDVAKINCSSQNASEGKSTKKQNGEAQTYLHGDIEFNENEEIFYQELLRRLSGVCEEKDLQVELFENREKRLSFYAFGSDIGDVKLRGRIYRIQTIYPENGNWEKVYKGLENTKMEWIACTSTEDAIAQIPFWVDRVKAIKQYGYV